MLNSSSALVLASIFNFGGSRPKSVGLRDYGEGNKQLGLCPSTPNCISTAEAANDDSHYVPPWTYNPSGGRGGRNPATREQAMAELKEVVTTLRPDNFEPKIVSEAADYLYVEYKSPLLGFIDDVEFYFSGRNDEVEYRSASRLGESDFKINRKRIRALRKELEKKGWRSVGF